MFDYVTVVFCLLHHNGPGMAKLLKAACQNFEKEIFLLLFCVPTVLVTFENILISMTFLCFLNKLLLAKFAVES